MTKIIKYLYNWVVRESHFQNDNPIEAGNMSEKIKIISDLIHGYIRITKDVGSIIDTESFQRLKYISQTTAYHLYPSANHTRFEHSLGVMKLADDFFENLESQFVENYMEENIEKDIINKKMKNNYYHLKYASLLHDVGHAPLSHIGEEFYDIEDIKTKINGQLSKLRLNELDFKKLVKGSNHEWMGVLVIICNFHEKLTEIFSGNSLEIDYEYIARIITGNKYEDSETFDLWDRDLIISLLNSETIDIDRLDYLMRDNFMSGMVGPNIDIERLLYSLVINEKKQLGFSRVGVSAIQKVIECRDSIYLWFCNHHTVVYTDYLLHECIEHMSELYKYKISDDGPPEFINKERLKDNLDKFRQFYDDDSEQENTLKLKNGLDADNRKNCLTILKEINYLPYKEAINKNEYFSVEAILERKTTDNEIYTQINKIKNLVKKHELSKHTERIINQLINRNFLKPIWKTLSDYIQFLEKNFTESDRTQIIKYITENVENRRKIVKIIRKKANCKVGEVFLIVKKNKFYFLPQLANIYICSYDMNGKETSIPIKDILPQKDYKAMFNEVAFYLYCKEGKEKEVHDEFISLMRVYKKINRIYKEI